MGVAPATVRRVLEALGERDLLGQQQVLFSRLLGARCHVSEPLIEILRDVRRPHVPIVADAYGADEQGRQPGAHQLGVRPGLVV
jgi:hypothetical protein